MSESYFVYLARCQDQSLYCGIAKNVEARIKQHNAGKGAKYTRGRRPVFLLFAAGPFEHGQALRLEYHIKRLPKRQKLNELKTVAQQEFLPFQPEELG